MKKLLLFCLAACLCAVASAQKVYFLYLQSEDQSPFYVRMGEKIVSSAASGFLILPNLTDNTYNLSIGFAKSQEPETRFSITISQNDKSYLIKRFDYGLGLFDFHELTVLKPATDSKDNTVYETRTDKFASLLSKAAGDPSLLKVPVSPKEDVQVNATAEEKAVVPVKEEEKKQEPVTVKTDALIPKAEDSVAVVTQQGISDTAKTETAAVTPPSVGAVEEVKLTPAKEEVVTPEKQDVVIQPAQEVSYQPSVIVRHSESSTTEGFGLVYFDKQEGRTDTIRILILPSKVKIATVESTASGSEQKIEMLSQEAVSRKTESRQETAVPESGEKKEAVKSTNCKDLASEKDFMKVRRNMAAEENDERMIEQAKKVFRGKCFSVEQVRYLSTLFLTSAAKYQFFDAAYEHVSDKENFASLQSEIKDEYYLKRFKALIGE